jgi:hypothetical protein
MSVMHTISPSTIFRASRQPRPVPKGKPSGHHPLWVAKTPWRCNWRHCAGLEGDSVAREVTPLAWSTIWTSGDYGIGIVLRRIRSDRKSQSKPLVRG